MAFPTLRVLLAPLLGGALASTAGGPWQPDRGDGTYRNPVLYADYSDPDVVRVGDDFYLVASSFGSVPGLPILHSRDLVGWTIVGHAAPRLPSPDFDRPQHGKGLWAPSLRHHDGLFFIYVGDPDRGIFMTTARDPRGPWEPLALVKEARGAIDPCPLWDDDGSVYLVHAWAKSRAGFNSVLTLNRMSPDGRRVLDEGATVFDGHEHHPTIEGPKFYKRNGWYYVFAPAGGVEAGWQTVLRSRRVKGPYEDRVVLDQGTTAVNGPHQGAWVETAGGENWFLHFQDLGTYGRVVHLQPLAWKGDWPVIGRDADGDGKGQPVAGGPKPRVSPAPPPEAPPTGDEFEGEPLGLQWQWNANPQPAWWSLRERSGFLRLHAAPASSPNLWTAPHLLLQKWPAPAFSATARLDPAGLRVGERAGVVVMGTDYAVLVVERAAEGLRLRQTMCHPADKDAAEEDQGVVPLRPGPIELRVSVDAKASCQFAWSRDGVTYQPIGDAFRARAGRWIGARVGLLAEGPSGRAATGHADLDWFRVE